MPELDLNKEAFELLVFDWDGTICDSLSHIVDSLRYALSRMQMPERDEDTLRSIIGLGLLEAMERLFPGINRAQTEELASHYREFHLASTSGNTPLFPGVERTLGKLHASGRTLAVATGKSRRGLNRAMQESGLESFFHFSRCADETFSKPHPQMLEEIMELSSAEPANVLMIGDSEHDLQMATNAGVRSAAVSYGAQDGQYLLKFKPVACFHSLAELPGWLAQITLANLGERLS